MNNRERYTGAIVQHDGDTWEVIGVGAQEGADIFCHLASKTRGQQRRNGFRPNQINDWVDQQKLEESVA